MSQPELASLASNNVRFEHWSSIGLVDILTLGSFSDESAQPIFWSSLSSGLMMRSGYFVLYFLDPVQATVAPPPMAPSPWIWQHSRQRTNGKSWRLGFDMFLTVDVLHVNVLQIIDKCSSLTYKCLIPGTSLVGALWGLCTMGSTSIPWARPHECTWRYCSVDLSLLSSN